MSGRPKLAGVERPSATVLRLPLREHQGREEDEGNSFPSFARPGKGLRTTVRGGAIDGPPKHAVGALGTTKRHGRSTERKRGSRRCSPQREAGQGRLGTTDFVRRVAAALRRRSMRAASGSRGEERGEMGKGVLGRIGLH